MKRKILFRGKCDNKWHYGLPYRIGKRTASLVITNAKHDYYNIYEIDANTLGQYTGLNDKKGIKIFEGDIVNACYDCGVIEFNCGVFGINWDYGRCDKTTMYGTFGQRHNLRRMDDEIIDRVEIVGNIYDNPELLKTK